MELNDTVEHDTFTVQWIIEDLQKENDSEIARDSTVNSRSEHELTMTLPLIWRCPVQDQILWNCKHY